jgi:hypothetical protein
VTTETRRTKIEVGWAAIAWAQFLVLVTAIDKHDFRLLGEFKTQLFNSPETLRQDPRPVASIALLLNAVALALTAFPLMPVRKDAEEYIVRAFEFHGTIFSVIGAYVWIFSFLAFLFYLNETVALAAMIAFFASFFWMGIACAIAENRLKKAALMPEQPHRHHGKQDS